MNAVPEGVDSIPTITELMTVQAVQIQVARGIMWKRSTLKTAHHGYPRGIYTEDQHQELMRNISALPMHHGTDTILHGMPFLQQLPNMKCGSTSTKTTSTLFITIMFCHIPQCHFPEYT
jgi:hypothetical protein